MKRIITIFAIVNLWLSASAAIKEFPTQQGFTVVLTDDWIEIPKDVLDQLSRQMAQVSTAKIQKWDYGYQLATGTNWAAYPYILVQVKEEGRIRESELANFKKVHTEMDKGLKEAEDSTGGFLSGATLGETVYDDQNHILFTSMQMNVQKIGPVVGLTAIKLTEKGAIQFMGYTLEKEADHYVPFYKKAAIDLRLPADLIYNPHANDFNFNGGRSAIIGGIVGALGALVWSLIKKKKTA